MPKKMMLLTACLLMAGAVFSQRLTPAVISAAGDVSKAGSTYLEWTLGEPVVETALSKNNLLTQGFHQPLLLVKKSPDSRLWEAVEVTILPNPVQYTCRALIKRQAVTPLSVELTDIHGRKLYRTVTSAKVDVIDLDFSSYTTGSYILLLRDTKSGLFRTFKIIKAQ